MIRTLARAFDLGETAGYKGRGTQSEEATSAEMR